jgi:hypothetical protein
MTGTIITGKAGERRKLLSAVFAGILRLFATFI